MSQFQSSRDKLAFNTILQLNDAPGCLLEHGWVPSSPWGILYRHLLVALPDLTGEFLDPLTMPDMDLQIFTDGSCKYPESASLRGSTWGVCVADLDGDDFVPISRGPLPGLLQTVARAEYTAAISAVKYALYKKRGFWICVDNQRVWQFLLGMHQGDSLPENTEPNHGLQWVLGDVCVGRQSVYP